MWCHKDASSCVPRWLRIYYNYLGRHHVSKEEQNPQRNIWPFPIAHCAKNASAPVLGFPPSTKSGKRSTWCNSCSWRRPGCPFKLVDRSNTTYTYTTRLPTYVFGNIFNFSLKPTTTKANTLVRVNVVVIVIYPYHHRVFLLALVFFDFFQSSSCFDIGELAKEHPQQVIEEGLRNFQSDEEIHLRQWCSGKGNEIWKEGKLTMAMTITENNDNDNDRKQQLTQPVLVAILVSTWSNVKLKSRMLSKSSSSCLLTPLSWNFRKYSETGC